MDVLKFLSDAEKSPWGTELSKDQILAMGAVFRQIEERNSQLRVELEQVKKVANDQAQLAATLKNVVFQLHQATYNAYWAEGERESALAAVFDSYPMLREWLVEVSE